MSNLRHFQTRGELTIIGMEEQRRYVDMFLANITPPAAYSKHISFIDFEAHGKDWQVRETHNRN